MRRFALVLALTAVSVPATAFVLGGGNPDKDCSVVFSGVDANVGDSGVLCTDADPSCDADGAANDACRFDVALCTRPDTRDCGAVDLTAMTVGGPPLPLPPLPSNDPGCGAPLAVSVPRGKARAATVLAHVGSSLGDVDYLNLCCVGEPKPYAAALCALGVDLRDAGCQKKIPKSIRKGLARARTFAAQAADHPTRAKKPVANADKKLAQMIGASRVFAKTDPCGNTLGLMFRHARFALQVP